MRRSFPRNAQQTCGGWCRDKGPEVKGCKGTVMQRRKSPATLTLYPNENKDVEAMFLQTRNQRSSSGGTASDPISVSPRKGNNAVEELSY